MIRELAGLMLANVLLLLLGAGILAIAGRPRAESVVVWSGLSLFTGIAGFFAVMPPLLYAGFSPTLEVLALLTAAAVGGGLLRRGSWSSSRWPGQGSWLLAAAIAIPIVLLALQAAVKRAVEEDWQLDWALKARFLAGTGGRFRGALDDRILSSKLYPGSHPPYPLGFSSLQALDYHAVGRFDVVFVHVQYVIVLAAFAITTWTVLRPYANHLLLTAGAVAIVASPAVQERVLSDPWDVLTGMFWVIGALCAGTWYADEEGPRLALCVVFLAAALETKMDALSNTAILFALMALLLVVQKRWQSLRHWLLAAGATALLIAPWQIYTKSHHLRTSVISPSPQRMVNQVGDVPTIVNALVTDALARPWVAVVPLCIGAALVMLVRGRSRPLAAAFLALFAALEIGLVLVYWNHSVPLHRLLNVSASRVITTEQLLALALLPLMLEGALGGLKVSQRLVPARHQLE
jgi:hypothetical protein